MRTALLRAGIPCDSLCIEIGPLHRPMLPKSIYENVKVIDVFNKKKLLEFYADDPGVDTSLIDEVDIIWKGSLAKSLDDNDGNLRVEKVANVAAILSSHNFEHQPDPVRFLRDCQNCLEDRGVLRMAIPNYQQCFDATRTQSSVGELLDSYYYGSEKPLVGSLFDSLFSHANISTPVSLSEKCYTQFRSWIDQYNDLDYVDCHQWCFTPDSFVETINHLVDLNLIALFVSDLHDLGDEFIVTLTKQPFAQAVPRNNSVSSRATTITSQIQASIRDNPLSACSNPYSPLTPFTPLERVNFLEMFKQQTHLADRSWDDQLDNSGDTFQSIVSDHDIITAPCLIEYLADLSRQLVHAGIASLAIPNFRKNPIDNHLPVATTRRVLNVWQLRQGFTSKRQYTVGSIADSTTQATWQDTSLIQCESSILQKHRVWGFTLSSFLLIMDDLWKLGMTDLMPILYSSSAGGFEFFVHLIKNENFNVTQVFTSSKDRERHVREFLREEGLKDQLISDV